MINKITGAILLSVPVVPAQAALPVKDWVVDGWEAFVEELYANLFLTIGAVAIIGTLLVAYQALMIVLEHEKKKAMREAGIPLEKARTKKPQKPFSQRMWDKAWAYVPLHKEQEVDLGHSYDGIRELDNRMPPWWLALFYGSIIFAFGYMYHYHWSGNDWSSEKEYLMAMQEAEEQVRRYRTLQTTEVDESSVSLLTDEAALADGKSVYEAQCASCHGQKGEGGVGPNMTDPYWIHGGSIQDVFKTIKYGVPEKGMIAWQAQLRPATMQKVASYIVSLQGSEPAGGKAQEGEYYDPKNYTAEPEEESSEQEESMTEAGE